jgi:hypothetical protein
VGARKGKTAEEFLAELEADPEYQARIRERDARIEAYDRELEAAERPIVDDLHRAGLEINSVWDLVNTSDPYPEGLPVLLDHFERGGYPDRVMESLGRSLAVEQAVVWWDRLKALYLAPRCEGEEEGAAIVLAGCATKAQLGDLIGFLALEERGDSRLFFLRVIKRLGGDTGRNTLEQLRDDPVLGLEATALLKTRRKRQA